MSKRKSNGKESDWPKRKFVQIYLLPQARMVPRCPRLAQMHGEDQPLSPARQVLPLGKRSGDLSSEIQQHLSHPVLSTAIVEAAFLLVAMVLTMSRRVILGELLENLHLENMFPPTAPVLVLEISVLYEGMITNQVQLAIHPLQLDLRRLVMFHLTKESKK
jgi:hypothetical protein